MSDLEKILYTSFSTIICGVIVFTCGKLIERFLLDPISDYRKTVGLIANKLIFHSNIYSNPTVTSPEQKEEVSICFRQLSADLSSCVYAIPLFSFFSLIGILPKKNDCLSASNYLIGISNALLNIQEVNDKSEKVKELLCIKEV